MSTRAPAAEGARASHYAGIAAFFDRFAADEDRWLERTRGYHDAVESIYGALVPPGQRVLEIGCGRGDLLASLEPSRGVGVDVSAAMVEAAQRRHPELEFHHGAGEELDLDETFDYVVLSDLVPYAYDLQTLFAAVARHCHPRSRVIVSAYSNLWRPLLALLTALRLRPSRPLRNWVAPRDLANLLQLAGLEVTMERKEILAPAALGPVSRTLNGYLAHMPLLRQLTLTSWLVARPLPSSASSYTVSVVVPCRNEAGSIHELVERIPEMGDGTEIVFVEGHSVDDTRERIEVEMAAADREVSLVVQSGEGKWNAVQEGFAAANNDVLMILDGDMTVAPEDLPKFYEAIAEGRGELINGSRMVYGMEPGAMRFLNMVGNRFFAGLLSRVLGQYTKDTLCGTKALHRADYARIAHRRDESRLHDPFGDFDLLIGAAQLGLKIADVPVRYGARIYGETNIRRFSHGGALLRLAISGYRWIWVRPVARGRARRRGD